MKEIGAKIWVIPEGYIPQESTGPRPQMTSHETVCMLNLSDKNALVKLTIFFSDREPIGPYKVEVGPRRTKHLRFNDLKEPVAIPKGVDYACLLESDVPIVAQHTRLDSRQAENALVSTIAYSVS